MIAQWMARPASEESSRRRAQRVRLGHEAGEGSRQGGDIGPGGATVGGRATVWTGGQKREVAPGGVAKADRAHRRRPLLAIRDEVPGPTLCAHQDIMCESQLVEV